MTPKQQLTYDFIRAFWVRHGKAPTYKQIAERSRVSIVTAREHVQAILDKLPDEIRRGFESRKRRYYVAGNQAEMHDARQRAMRLSALDRAAHRINAQSGGELGWENTLMHTEVPHV